VGDSYNTPSINVITGQPQHVWGSYFWANYNTSALLAHAGVSENDCDNSINTSTNTCDDVGDGYSVNMDDEVHAQASGAFDGTSGVGCGTAETMNAIETCTDGVGFWATDQGNCSDLSGYIGSVGDRTSAATYLQGTLYKCASNAWVEYYTPYTYPRMSRGEEPADETAATLALVTPVSTPTTNQSAQCVFSSNESGNITYGGTCGTGSKNVAVAGNNAVIWNLAPGTYSDCTITVTDAAGNASTPLAVTEFVITPTSGVPMAGGGGMSFSGSLP